jgi:hypothetical protein
MIKKRILAIFFVAFVLNVLWENLHSVLYVNYMGGRISEFILLRAAFWDAVMITAICLPFLFISGLKKYDWLIILIGIIISVGIELWALSTGRWMYNDLMPIIPMFSVGLTPTIQLGLLGFISFKVQNYSIKT